MNALAYLDFSRLRNALRGIVTQPSRLILWALFAAYFVFLAWQRIFLSSHHRSLFADLRDPYATVAAGIVMALFGLTVSGTAQTGRLSVFGDRADAYFLARSALSERAVALWLQLRSIAVNIWRLLFTLAIALIYYAHGNFIGAALGLIGLFLLMEMAKLPVWLLSRRITWLFRLCYALAVAGVLIAVAALLPAAWPALEPLRDRLVALGLGNAALAIWHGSPLALVLLYLILAIVVTIGTLAAHDMYPELYASSRYIADLRARVRRSPISLPSSFAAPKGATRSSDTALRGPWVEMWKQLAFLRRRNGRGIVAMVVGSAIVLGVIAGFAERHDSGLGIAIASPILMLVFIILTMGSVSLAGDLAKPLWWMGDGALWIKLLAWTLGSTLTAMAFLAIAALVGGAIGAPAAIPVLLCIAIALPLAVRCIGMLVYALFPSQTDQRGPATAIRMLAVYVSFVPAAGAAILLGIVARNATLGFVAGTIVFIGEGALALVLAAWRIAGRGAEIALAESS